MEPTTTSTTVAPTTTSTTGPTSSTTSTTSLAAGTGGSNTTVASNGDLPTTGANPFPAIIAGVLAIVGGLLLLLPSLVPVPSGPPPRHRPRRSS